MTVEKAIEISDAKIQFVSLVDKAANKRQFLITKAADGKAQFSTLGKILKVDDVTHYVTGIVYEPLVEDAHGNFMTEDEIRKAAYWFAKNGDKVDLQHSFEPTSGVTVVENYVAPCDMEIGGVNIVKGTWLMTAEVENPMVWEKVQKGEVTGFSMGGVGSYSEVDTELPAEVQKVGLFKRLASVFGLEVVAKGEIKDRYDRDAKSSNFWNAFYALQDTLLKYDWQTDRSHFEEDEGVIREALSEFSEIVTALLATSSVVKSMPVTKAGKKISGKNRNALQSIHDTLGNLLSELDDETEKEETSVTKTEIQTLVEESVKKALETAPATSAEESITAEAVQKMVDEAITKALTPTETEETLTAEIVQKMVSEAVEKAVEPILKNRGVPSNLTADGQPPVTKTAPHYLAGIL